MLTVLGVSALLLFAGGNVWLYLQGARALEAQFKTQRETQIVPDPNQESVALLFRQLNEWTEQVTLSTLLAGGGLVVALGLGLLLRRRAQLRAQTLNLNQMEDLNRKLERAQLNVNRYKSERSTLQEELRQAYDNMEDQVREKTESLTRRCDELEKELNSRLRAEKALTYQAKELERSKDVLELHVQARTKELQVLKSRYELILNSAGEGIYGLDLKGRTTFVNPAAAKLTGWQIEEMIGKSERELFSSPETPADDDGMAKDQEGHHLGEQTFRRRDGSLFPVEYVRTPLIEDERIFGAVVIFKDITERKQTEDALARKAAELARSNGELEQFAYVASHDLQEPLRKIQAFGDRLQSKCEAVDLKEGRDYLDRMLRAAARMQTLINDLLTFSRVISTNHPFVPVDLQELAREVLSDLEFRIEQTEAKVHLGELPTIEADPTQIRQLLQNLISNALKFNKPDHPPEVEVSAEIRQVPFSGGEAGGEREECILRVKDNGIGFEERYIDRIFAVFQRLHGRSEYEGTGVGLAVCRRITDRHGGTIEAESRLGEGATFSVTLPVCQSDQAHPPVQEAA